MATWNAFSFAQSRAHSSLFWSMFSHLRQGLSMVFTKGIILFIPPAEKDERASTSAGEMIEHLFTICQVNL
jgi:hypothetical protein